MMKDQGRPEGGGNRVELVKKVREILAFHGNIEWYIHT